MDCEKEIDEFKEEEFDTEIAVITNLLRAIEKKYGNCLKYYDDTRRLNRKLLDENEELRNQIENNPLKYDNDYLRGKVRRLQEDDDIQWHELEDLKELYFKKIEEHDALKSEYNELKKASTETCKILEKIRSMENNQLNMDHRLFKLECERDNKKH